MLAGQARDDVGQYEQLSSSVVDRADASTTSTLNNVGVGGGGGGADVDEDASPPPAFAFTSPPPSRAGWTEQLAVEVSESAGSVANANRLFDVYLLPPVREEQKVGHSPSLLDTSSPDSGGPRLPILGRALLHICPQTFAYTVNLYRLQDS